MAKKKYKKSKKPKKLSKQEIAKRQKKNKEDLAKLNARIDLKIASGEKLESSDYRDYIQSQKWEDMKTLFAFSRGMKKCEKCERCSKERNIHVHHNSYENMGYESLDDLNYLCYGCHTELHKMVPSWDKDLKKKTKDFIANEDYIKEAYDITVRINKKGNTEIKDILEPYKHNKKALREIVTLANKYIRKK